MITIVKKKIASNNQSKTTSLSNNAIQNAMQLSRVNKHNLRKYDNNPELIFTIYGSSNLFNDVKNLYKNEFETARIEYNNSQKRDNRKIDNYFEHISKNSNRDLACEIIIELGDMHFWKDISKESKYKMVDVFKEQIKYLTKIVPEFKLANATIHFDETSPHLHIVGVPVKDGYINGMKKQVGKSLIFTKDSLKSIQDKMRGACINSFNRVYEVDYELKGKQVGRNKDFDVKDMGSYQELNLQMLQNELKRTRNIIVKQKEQITFLEKQVKAFQSLWKRFKIFFRDKVLFKQDKTYEKIANELYENQLFTKDDMDHSKYGRSINNKPNKDFER